MWSVVAFRFYLCLFVSLLLFFLCTSLWKEETMHIAVRHHALLQPWTTILLDTATPSLLMIIITTTTTTTTTTTIIIIIIIVLKGANRDFLQSPHCAANRLQHIRSSGPGIIVCKSRATHQALITCYMSCATWYEGTAQLLSLTELKSHLF